MRVSQRKVNPTLEKELSNTLYQLITDINKTQEARLVLEALLGTNELTAVIKRLAVAYWLYKGRGISNIRDNLAVAPATIETIKHQLAKSEGFRIAIKKITADEWANKWSERIKKLIR